VVALHDHRPFPALWRHVVLILIKMLVNIEIQI
jgi:hypothetical protein